MTSELVSGDRRERITAFDSRIREELASRYGDLHPSVRPRIVTTALDSAAARLRQWLDNELDRVADDRLPQVLGRVRSDVNHGSALAEMATSSVLRDAGGFDVVPDPLLGSRTPDLMARDRDSGTPLLVAEVWSRSITPEVLAEQRDWLELARAVSTVRSPVRLAAQVNGFSHSRPPGQAGRQRIVGHLRKYLAPAGVPLGWATSVEGIRFEVVQRINGSVAQLDPISAFPTIDRDHVVDAIEVKVRRYSRTVTEWNLPLLIVLGAEPRTGLTASFVQDVLDGKDSVVFAIDPTTGTGHARQHKLRMTAAPPIFDIALSAVGFVDVRNGADAELTIWPIDGALRPLPEMSDRHRIHVMAPTGKSRRA